MAADGHGAHGGHGRALGASAVVIRDGRLLVVRRSAAPSAGRWALPGGAVRPGEPARHAAVRELAEETGLRAAPGAVCAVAEPDVGRVGPPVTVVCHWAWGARGRARAGSDAAEVAWVGRDELVALDAVDGLVGLLVRARVVACLR